MTSWTRTQILHMINAVVRFSDFGFLESRLGYEPRGDGGSGLLSKLNVVFAAECNGMGMDSVVVSLHRSYSEYVDLVKELHLEGEMV
jgi:hypothetical protein